MDAFEERQTIRGEFMPLSILRAVWKQKLLILASWFAVMTIGALVVFQLPAVYQARTVILIEHQRIPERYVTSTVNEDLANRLNRISQQILSYDPLLRLIEEFNLYSDQRNEMVQEELVGLMRDDISVRLVDGWAKTNAPAFQITFEGDDASVVAQVANRLATLFINENLRTRANQALGTSEFLTNQLEERRREMERQEERLTSFRTQHMGELPEQQGVLMGELRRLETELDRIEAAKTRAEQSRMMYQSSLSTAQSTLEMLKRVDTQQKREQALSDAMRGSASGVQGLSGGIDRQLMVDYERAQARLMDLQARYSAQHPDVSAQRGLVERLEKMVETAVADAEAATAAAAAESKADAQALAEATAVAEGSVSLVGQSVMREVERVENLRTQLKLVERDLISNAEQRQRILGEIGAVESKLSRIPMHEQELKKVVRDYDISNQNYRQLLDKRLEADLASEMETRQKAEKFSVLEAARLPEKPIRPDRPILLAIICAFGLVAGCVVGFGLELRKNVILGEWEMPPDVPLLGQVPFIRFDEELDASDSQAAASGGSRKRALIASTVALSVLALVVAAGFYFEWIPFPSS